MTSKDRAARVEMNPGVHCHCQTMSRMDEMNPSAGVTSKNVPDKEPTGTNSVALTSKDSKLEICVPYEKHTV